MDMIFITARQPNKYSQLYVCMYTHYQLYNYHAIPLDSFSISPIKYTAVLLPRLVYVLIRVPTAWKQCPFLF
jgi:hypothetical protein